MNNAHRTGQAASQHKAGVLTLCSVVGLGVEMTDCFGLSTSYSWIRSRLVRGRGAVGSPGSLLWMEALSGRDLLSTAL